MSALLLRHLLANDLLGRPARFPMLRNNGTDDGDGNGGGTGGGTGNGDGNGDGGGSTGDGGNGDGNQNGGTGNDDGGTGSGEFNLADLPEAAQKIVRDARAEAAKYRTERNESRTVQQQQADQIKAINKALGIESDEPNADDLQKTLDQREQQLRELKVENAFGRAAKEHSADEELTLAVLSRKGVLSGLDPDAEDFASKLSAAIKTEVDANPKLKVTQVAPKSGSKGFNGNSDGGRSSEPVSLGDAVLKAMS